MAGRCIDPYFLDLDMQAGGQVHGPAVLTPEKLFPVSIGEEVEWTFEPVLTIRRIKNSLSKWESNCEPMVVQPVASQYNTERVAFNI
jgi:hypothetical protein